VPAQRLTAWIGGRVQGVGFRWWARAAALELGLSGSATNLPDGWVEVIAEGPRPALESLLTILRSGTGPGHTQCVVERWAAAHGGLAGFDES